jgi:hypothetical protein
MIQDNKQKSVKCQNSNTISGFFSSFALARALDHSTQSMWSPNPLARSGFPLAEVASKIVNRRNSLTTELITELDILKNLFSNNGTQFGRQFLKIEWGQNSYSTQARQKSIGVYAKSGNVNSLKGTKLYSPLSCTQCELLSESLWWTSVLLIY